jgi:peptidyl-prolyl cis-trans isomerase C
MADQQRPNLALGEAPERLRGNPSSGSRRLLAAILTMQIFVLLALVIAMAWMAPWKNPAPADSSAASERWRAAAVELEERGLDDQAAAAWSEHLEANPDSEEYADILYRVGKLQMQAEQFDRAAAAFVRAQLAAKNDKELNAKIGPKLVECLRRSGRYGEVGRELARQVKAVGADPKRGKVLAAMAGDEITDADLDRMIERRVDRMLAMQGSADDPAAREAVLRRLSSPQARQQMLRELLQTELSCRRARELKLDREDEYLQARDQMTDTLLANHFLSRQLGEIRPTAVDLESYYTANRTQYRQPESIDVVAIRLKPDEDPTALASQIKSAEDFRNLAKQRREGAAEKAQDGPPPTRLVVRGVSDVVLGDTEALFDLPQDQWTREPHAGAGGEKYFVLVQQKNAARIPPLEEVESQVRAEYTARKQQELSEQLFRDLMTRYDVRLAGPAESGERPGKQPDGKPEPAEEEKKP